MLEHVKMLYTFPDWSQFTTCNAIFKWIFLHFYVGILHGCANMVFCLLFCLWWSLWNSSSSWWSKLSTIFLYSYLLFHEVEIIIFLIILFPTRFVLRGCCEVNLTLCLLHSMPALFHHNQKIIKNGSQIGSATLDFWRSFSRNCTTKWTFWIL